MATKRSAICERCKAAVTVTGRGTYAKHTRSVNAACAPAPHSLPRRPRSKCGWRRRRRI